MKLLTTVPPRTDGTVRITQLGKFGAPDLVLVFKPDASGALVGDVPDDMVPGLLASNNFEPADEADFDRADELLEASGLLSAGDSAPDASDLDGGMLIEARTPPRAKARPAKRRVAMGG